MKKTLIRFVTAAMVVLLLVFGACSSDDTASIETGIVLIGVTDKPDEDITAIEVTTNLIEASVSSAAEDEAEWRVILETEKSFDLIEVAGVEDILGQGELPAAKYNQIRMHVTSVMVTVNGETKEATVPSGTIKIVSPLEVKAGETIVATFDFDAEQSVIVTGTGSVTFKPVVKLLVRKGSESFKPEGAGPSGTTGSNDSEVDTEEETDTQEDTDSEQDTQGQPGQSELPEMKQGDEEGFFLNITSPSQSEVIVADNTIEIVGQTSVDAAVSIGDEFVDLDLDGNFSSSVTLEDGINIIEIIASIATGEQYDQIITVIYTP